MRYLVRLTELELIDRERRMVERRIRQAPPMDYRDNPQHRVRYHFKWTKFTPPLGLILLRR